MYKGTTMNNSNKNSVSSMNEDVYFVKFVALRPLGLDCRQSGGAA